MNPKSKKNILILDYDNTITPFGSDALKDLDRRITAFLVKLLNISEEKADNLRKEYNQTYGTTWGGLKKNHSVDPEDFFDFIQDIHLENLPQPDEHLINWLKNCDMPVYIFTNARFDWVLKGLSPLGIEVQEEFFSGLVDMKQMNWEGKPHLSAYKKMEKLAYKNHGSEIHLIYADDSLENLNSARKRNWETLWIHPIPESDKKFHVTNLDEHSHYISLIEVNLDNHGFR